MLAGDNMAGDDVAGEHVLSEYMPVLSPSEWRVLKVLAENGPLSGYDFHLGGKRVRGSRRALMSSGYWIKVLKKLGPEGYGLIQPVELRGRPREGAVKRRKRLFWLSDRGLALVLAENVNPKVVLGHVERVYGENSLQALFVKLRAFLGVEVYRLYYRHVFERGLNEDTLMTVVGIALLQTDRFKRENPQRLNQRLNRLLEPYPELLRAKKQFISEVKRRLLSLEE